MAALSLLVGDAEEPVLEAGEGEEEGVVLLG